MKKELNILIIEGNHEEAVLLKESLLVISSIKFVKTLKQAIKEIQNFEFEIIFLDLELSDSTGMNTLSEVLKYAEKTTVIVFSGLEDKKVGLEAIHRGAQDYLVTGSLNSDMLSRIVNYSIKRKQGERIIKDSAMRWLSTFNAMSDSVSIIDNDGFLIEYNSATLDMFDISEKDVKTRHCWDIVHNLSEPIENCPIVRMKNSKKHESMVFQDSERWLEVSVDPICDSEGNIKGAVHVVSDITSSKQAEIELKNQFNTYYTLLQNLNGMVYNCENDNKWTMNFVSEGCFNLTGYKPEDLIQNKKIAFMDIILSEYRDIIWGEWQDQLKRQETVEMTYQIKTASGKIKWVWERGQGVFDEKGKLLNLEGYITDITERKNAEDQIARDLEVKDTLLKELYHRTKNNMQVISSMLKMQAQHSENEFIHESFKEIIHKIQAMSLVHQKLYQAEDLSRINLKEYIEDILKLLMISYNIRSELFSFKLDLKNVFVTIDSATPLGLVLNELISNVFKHSFPDNRKGKLKISMEQEESGDINIQLTDNGVGFSPGFNPEKTESMGLQTAYSLVNYQLNGSLSYKVKDGLSWFIKFNDAKNKLRV